jgi:hypothetical protein
MVRPRAEVDLLTDRPRKEGRLKREKVMSAIKLHRRGATVVVFAMVMSVIQVPAWAGAKASISIADAPAVVEGNTGSKQIEFTLRAKGPGTSRASVSWDTEDDTASQGSDYGQASGTVSFASGKTQKIRITAFGDIVDEANETFNIVLSGAVNAKITDSQGVGTINDDDLAPALSISDDVVGEGNNGGTAPASFDVTLSQPATTPITVAYQTANGTATAGADYDSLPLTTLTFAPGETVKSVAVNVLGDDLGGEGNHTFTVNLSNPSGATIADGVGLGTIIDDEGDPAVSIGDATVIEGGVATFPVTLSHPSAQVVTVDYAALGATASIPADFQAASGELEFAVGTTSQNIALTIADDGIDEPAEMFLMTLNNHPGALAADVEGNGIITDNDNPPRVRVANLTVREGAGPASMIITLSHPSSQDVVIEYAARDGSAKVVKDYAASASSFTLAAGDLGKTVSVPVTNDSVAEWRERFAFDVTATLNADLGDGAATVTIMDDDRKPSYTKVTKRIRDGRIHVSGHLSPAHEGRRMTVMLKKRSNGRWVTVRTKRPLLSKGIDVNKDGALDSKFATLFFNPRNTKRCRIIASFAGDVHHFPSTARRTFHC